MKAAAWKVIGGNVLCILLLSFANVIAQDHQLTVIEFASIVVLSAAAHKSLQFSIYWYHILFPRMHDRQPY